MKCIEYKKWICLDIDAELSDRERDKLDEHLQVCSSCRNYYEEIKANQQFIERISKIEPVLTYPENLVTNIVNATTKKGKSFDMKNIWSQMPGFTFSNKVRLMAFITIILLIGFFGYQQFIIMNKLSTMEQKIEKKSDDIPELYNTSSLIINRLLKEFASGNEGEQIVLDKETLELFIESYKDLKTDHDELIELLNENMKDLEGKFSKQDIRKLKKLLQEDNLEKKLSTNL